MEGASLLHFHTHSSWAGIVQPVVEQIGADLLGIFDDQLAVLRESGTFD